MANVLIYTKPTCPFCHRAKDLLTQKGVSFDEVNISADPSRRSEMIEKASGRTTVPQVFIDGIHIGGCDDLFALDAKGELDKKLAA